MTNVFLDAEYFFTCSMREGMIPNYKYVIDMFKQIDNNVIFYAYFVGSKEKKKSVVSFLIRNGINYVNVLDLNHVSKTQVVGSTIAIDVMKTIDETSTFAFLTGDDYMISIAEHLVKYNQKPHIYYFPVILSKELEKINCKFIRLPNSYFMHRDKDKGGNGN